MAEDIGLFEAIYSQRAIRHIKPDPVPDEILARVLIAAHHAASVGFTQPWDFIVVRDRERRRHGRPDRHRFRHPVQGAAAARARCDRRRRLVGGLPGRPAGSARRERRTHRPGIWHIAAAPRE